MPKYGGASTKNTPTEQRVDTRRLTVRLADSWSDPDGAVALLWYMWGFVSLFLILPLGAIFSFIPVKVLYSKFLNPLNTLHNLPYRVPITSKAPDGSTYIPDKPYKKNKHLYKAKGITLYGRDLKTNLQVWGRGDDDTTHGTVLGTTGSGKTELIFGFIFNQLIHDSGFITIDAKGDISFQRRVCQLLRRFGREDDLLTISFSVGKRDFLRAHEDKPTNTFNLMASNSSGMLIELLSGLLDGDGEDIWKGRAIAFIAALTRPLVYLRDKKEFELSPQKYMDYMELAELERFVHDNEYSHHPMFGEVLKPLRGYLMTLPGYDANKIGKQEQQTNEQFGYITMQLTRSLNDLGYSFGHIFGDEVGEIDISDVVLNRRCLTGLLPSLERSLPTLTMLGRLLIGSIKQMMAGSLGSGLEGTIRIGIDSRPTTARNFFRIVLDEVGYMMVTGMSIIPAQARSLNISMIFAAQSYTDIKRGSAEEAEAIWDNSNQKFIGRITGGEKSETMERVTGVAGSKIQMFMDGYESYFNVTGDLAYRPNEQVRREIKSQIDYHDIAAQENGEFTLITPKKFDGGRSGSVAVIHLLGFYTKGDAELDYIYLNDFVPITVSDAKEVNVAKQIDLLKGFLEKGTLSQEMQMSMYGSNNAIVAENVSHFNFIGNLAANIQTEILEQADNPSFVNLPLEVTLSSLYEVISGFDGGEYQMPKDRASDAKTKSLFDNSDDSIKQASKAAEDYSSNTYAKDIDAQKANFKMEGIEASPAIKKEVAKLHQEGYVADINSDDERQLSLKKAFKEQLDEDGMSPEAMLFADRDEDYNERFNHLKDLEEHATAIFNQNRGKQWAASLVSLVGKLQEQELVSQIAPDLDYETQLVREMAQLRKDTIGEGKQV